VSGELHTSTQRSPWTARLELAATLLLIVVALLVGGLTVWDRLNPAAAQPQPDLRPQAPLPSAPVSIDGAPTRGDRNAKVALIEFSEFQCPFCAKSAHEVLPHIEREYLRTGKLLFAWKHYPLAMHEHAQKAAEASECADRQGKFWDFHDWAFKHQKALDVSNLHGAAKTLGLDTSAFQTCLDGQTTAKVKADFDTAVALSVSGTPTWFVGVLQGDSKVKVSVRIDGARPLGDFQNAINQVLATASTQ
jgi:protein-disulfide isomerase